MKLSTVLREAVGFRSGGRNLPTVAYYVTTVSPDILIHNGIEPDVDGYVHFLTKLACASAVRDHYAAQGIVSTVWRIDVSGLKISIDPNAEIISAASVEPDDDEMLHHGFMAFGALGPERVMSEMTYC